jgi:predicted peptidase
VPGLFSTLGALGLGLVLAAPSVAQTPRIRNTRFAVPDVGMVSFGLVVPEGAAADGGRPLVLVLHAGGERVAYQGSRIVQELFLPGLGALGAIIVAPDCPAASWTEPAAERAVLALVEHVRQTERIDPRRILIAGFSMGGRGAWFLSRRHPELFTDAIVMAAPAPEPGEAAGTVPTYVIHSRDDRIVSFAPVAQAVGRLEAAGYPVQFAAVDNAGHIIGRFVEPLREASAWLAARWRR